MSKRDPHMDRRALFASAAAAALLAASGVSASGIPRKGGRLRMALSGAARSDTWASTDGLFMQVARQGLVFDSLTEVAADGTLRGELATGWQASNDARVWQFDIRKGVKFHDGALLTAQDVVAALDPLIDGVVGSTGPLGVRIVLETPDPGLPLRLAHPDFVIRASHASQDGIGTGLYRVTHFAPGQQLLATRVEGHYKGDTAGWFDEVEIVSIPSEPVRAEALGGYLIDAADLSDAELLAGLPDIILLPNNSSMMQAVSRDLAQPAQIGAQRAMDNLRAAERWWFA
ncbi:MAG: ABC transporter substrate-binding protein [Sulfitobacter sp.]